ncbi:MAG TPA: GNAT family N-acetyltransferase [Pseudonocardiaceae bacterium]|nr:GNAT family N-acetyltransferase [Pseudonocardiaceae bacterium]
MDRQHRIPALLARSDPLAVTSVVCANPDAEVLAKWDAMVAGVPQADVTQLSAWARLRGTVGYTPLYLLVWHGSELVAGAQILHRRFPVIGTVGYLPYGPVIVPASPAREDVCRELSVVLAQIARRRLRMLFIQPPDGAGDVSAQLLSRGFRPSSAEVAPSGSLRIDLAADEAALRRGLSKRLRTWTRQWPTRGVTVRRGTEQDLGLLIELIGRSASHQGYEPLSDEYLRPLYRLLAPAGHAVLFIGELHGTPVAAEFYTACGGMLRLRLRGLDRSGEAARLSVPAAITWEAMRWAKAQGFAWFDFGGLRAPTLRALLDGDANSGEQQSVDHFKTNFGGTPYRYPVPVEVIHSPILRITYDLTRRWPAGRQLLTHATRLARGTVGPRTVLNMLLTARSSV